MSDSGCAMFVKKSEAGNGEVLSEVLNSSSNGITRKRQA